MKSCNPLVGSPHRCFFIVSALQPVKGGRGRGRGGGGKRSVLDHIRHLNPEDILVVHRGLGIIRWLSG